MKETNLLWGADTCKLHKRICDIDLSVCSVMMNIHYGGNIGGSVASPPTLVPKPVPSKYYALKHGQKGPSTVCGNSRNVITKSQITTFSH